MGKSLKITDRFPREASEAKVHFRENERTRLGSNTAWRGGI